MVKMDFRKETICSLFSADNLQFVIPDYQRAYSWEEEHYKQFFNDIYEQSKSENEYFLGNIFVEKQKDNNNILEIVDGQQRITTIIIFISAICTLEKTNMEISRLAQKYITNNGQPKLLTSKIDHLYFEAAIINNDLSKKAATPSQKNIEAAKKFFLQKLKDVNDASEIINMFNKLEQSIITVTILDGKTESAFMFELQNNRGKKLTEMEKVKAYLMYQIYTNEKSARVDKTVAKVSEIFEEIYRLINSMKINEDALLRYHCNAYYGYTNIDKYNYILDFLKEKIGGISEKDKKINFIIDRFALELQKTFENVKKMETDKTNKYIRRLRILGFKNYQKLYPLIINGYRVDNKSKNYLENLFLLIELLAFRIALIPTNRNVKLNPLLDGVVDFRGDLNKLYRDIKRNFDSDEGRWTDKAMEEVLNRPIYRKVADNVLQFILKLYEEHISEKECPKLKNISIEHISPKQPKPEENTGYALTKTKPFRYLSDFENGGYLHCLGNLALSTGEQNARLYNNNFKEKLVIYSDCEQNLTLKQQEEIQKFTKNSRDPQWGMTEIDARHEKIVTFIMQEWGFENHDKRFNYDPECEASLENEIEIERKWKSLKKPLNDDDLRQEIKKQLETKLPSVVRPYPKDKYVLMKETGGFRVCIWIDKVLSIGFEVKVENQFEEKAEMLETILDGDEFSNYFIETGENGTQIWRTLNSEELKNDKSFSEYIDFISEKYMVLLKKFEDNSL